MDDSASRPAVSVKFTPPGRVYTYPLPDAFGASPPAPGAAVVCCTGSGPALATVVPTVAPLTPKRLPREDHYVIVRRASHEDVVLRLKHQQREREAAQFCQLKIRERGLAMKLTRVEQLFDGSKLIFYFTADGRIDFRELVRDLAAEYRTRIEMRQIGVRDEARMLGGYGSCGRPLCCTTWLQGFAPVSIKMAKQQKLSLNPSKLSGVCGRLKCCLRYELPNAHGDRFAGCSREGSCSGSCSGNCGENGCSNCGKGNGD